MELFLRRIFIDPDRSVGELASMLHLLTSIGMHVVNISNGVTRDITYDDETMRPTMIIDAEASMDSWHTIDVAFNKDIKLLYGEGVPYCLM